MADLTVKDGLNSANPNNIADLLRDVSIGDVLAGLVAPQERARTGLSSSTTQVHDIAAVISAVSVANSAIVIVSSGVTAGVGEVAITYAAGIATLEFQAAVTQYEVMEVPVTDIATALAVNLT